MLQLIKTLGMLFQYNFIIFEKKKEKNSSNIFGGRSFWRSGKLFGRTPISWLKLLLFYLLFCGILALLWGLCIGLMFQTVDIYIPKYIQDKGLIGQSTGGT